MILRLLLCVIGLDPIRREVQRLANIRTATFSRLKQVDAVRHQRVAIQPYLVEAFGITRHSFAAPLAHIAHDNGSLGMHILSALRAPQRQKGREITREARRCGIKTANAHARLFSWSGLRRVGHEGPISTSVTSMHSTASLICVSPANTSVIIPAGASPSAVNAMSISE